MKIVRNGEEFYLTDSELEAAYYEQQEKFDREDIEIYLNDSYLESHNHEGITLEQLAPLIPDMAKEYRKRIDNGAFDWWDVADEAISYIREGEMI